MDRRTLVGFSLGPLATAVVSAVSLPVLAWVFPPEMVGQLSMLQVAISLSTLLFSLGLDQAYIREYYEVPDRAQLLFQTAAPGLLLLFASLIAILAVDRRLLSQLLFAQGSAQLSMLIVVCLITAFLSRFLSLIFRMEERAFAYSFSQVLAKFLFLVFVLGYALFWSSRTLRFLIGAQALALLLAFVIFAWPERRMWFQVQRSRVFSPRLRSLLIFGFPLTLAGIASWGVAMLDRVFLRSTSTFQELAVYSVAASIAAGVNIIAGVLNTIWSPLVYKWAATNVDMRRIDMVASLSSTVTFVLVCLAGGFSWILAYVLPAAYGQVPTLLVGCMVAPLFYTLSEVTGIGIAVSRRTVFSFGASGGALLTNVILCAILVPRHGAVGAMTATACAFWVFFVLRTEFSALTWRKARRASLHFSAAGMLALALGHAAFGARWPVAAAIAWWALLALLLLARHRTVRRLWHVWRVGGSMGDVQKAVLEG